MFKFKRLVAAATAIGLLVLGNPAQTEQIDVDVRASFRQAIGLTTTPVRFNADANEYITYDSALTNADFLEIGTNNTLGRVGTSFYFQHTAGTAGTVVISAEQNALVDVACETTAVLSTTVGTDADLTFQDIEIALNTGTAYDSGANAPINAPTDGNRADCAGTSTESFTQLNTGSGPSPTILIGGRIRGINAVDMSSTTYRAIGRPDSNPLTVVVTYN